MLCCGRVGRGLWVVWGRVSGGWVDGEVCGVGGLGGGGWMVGWWGVEGEVGRGGW